MASSSFGLRRRGVGLALLALLSSLAASSSVASASNVLDLTAGNFDSRIAQDADAAFLVEFYAPWCGHCKQLAPTLDQLAARHHPDGTAGQKVTYIAKVDATKQRALAARFQVQGYPTLFHLSPRGREVRKYEGSRGLDDMSRWLDGGYESAAKLPPLASPFGPTGRIKGFLIKMGNSLLDLHGAMVDRGWSEFAAGGLLVGLAMGLVLTAVIVLAVSTEPAPPPRRPHQE